MGKLDRVIAVGALLCACSSSAPPQEGRVQAPRAKAALNAPAKDPRLDADGHLKPGSLKVGWFEIPVGFERVAGSTERVANFEAAGVSVEQLRAYVDARGTPAKVELMPHGEIYQQIAPSHSRLLPPVSVTVLAVDSKKLRLVVEDHTPSGEPNLNPQQAMDKLAKARDRTE